MKRSAIRGFYSRTMFRSPDFTSLHPGYITVIQCVLFTTEALRRRGYGYFVGATLVANVEDSRLKSLLRKPLLSSASLRLNNYFWNKGSEHLKLNLEYDQVI